MHINLLVYASLVFLLAGCASVDARPAFDDTQRILASRGVQTVYWRSGGEEDEEVDATVRSILTRELTVDDAVQIALLNNRNLQATYEHLRVAQADLVRAGLLRNPIFDLEARFSPNGKTAVDLGVVQDFIDVLFIPLRTRIASEKLEAVKLLVAGEVFDLAARVRAAFFALQGAEQMLEMRRQVNTAAEASFEVAKRLRAAGNNTELELVNEQAMYEESKLDLRRAEVSVLKARERLNELMGVWGVDTGWRIGGRLPEPPTTEVSYDGLERRAVEQSIELAATRHEIEQLAATLGLARPLTIFADTGAGAGAEREPEGEWSVGPALSLPIPLFDQGQPREAAARAELRRAEQGYHATAVTLRARVRIAHAALVAARERALYYSRMLLPLRHRIVEQTQLQYNAMQLGPAQLLMAKQQQIETGSAYIEALLDYWIQRTELELLLQGRMTRMSETSVAGTPSRSERSDEGH